MTRTSSRSFLQRPLPALLLFSLFASPLAFFAFPPRAYAAATVIFLTATSGSPQSWAVPNDWNSEANEIHCIGGGGGGASPGSNVPGGGGGGGAWARSDNVALTPGGTATFSLGAAVGPSGTGADTWVSNTGSQPTLATQGCLAKAGAGASGNSGGAAGQSASSVGDAKNSGGSGGSGGGAANDGGGAGGGAGGPNGVGAQGGAGSASAAGSGGGGGGANGGTAGTSASGQTAGAGGNNRLGSGGGAAGTTGSRPGGSGSSGGGGGGGREVTNVTAQAGTGGVGGMDAVWSQTSDSATAGPGGGGGGSGGAQGSGTSAAPGGAGGSYGAGGGGAGVRGLADSVGGNSAQGIIVITYTPTAAPDAPTNLITTSITGAVSLSWTAPASSGSSGITSYKIYRDTTSPATTLLFNQTSTTTATYTDSSAVHGTTYYYRVTAVNAVGESGYSNERVSGSNSGRIIRLKGAVRIKGGTRLR